MTAIYCIRLFFLGNKTFFNIHQLSWFVGDPAAAGMLRQIICLKERLSRCKLTYIFHNIFQICSKWGGGRSGKVLKVKAFLQCTSLSIWKSGYKFADLRKKRNLCKIYEFMISSLLLLHISLSPNLVKIITPGRVIIMENIYPLVEICW